MSEASTYLPLVDRELRWATRRPSTYKVRFWVPALALTLFAAMLVSLRMSNLRLGSTIFGVLSAIAFIYCFLTGVFFTADCLSREKREGTLGLLFLTDLRGYDVVFGKLAVHSLDAVYGLMSVMPILGLPVFFGGVLGAEFWRTCVMLAVCIGFSLGMGLMVSSIGESERTVILATFLILIFFTFGLPALWWVAVKTIGDYRVFDLIFLLPSPLYGFKMARTAAGTSSVTEFWKSLGMLMGLTTVWVSASCLILPRVFRQGAGHWGSKSREKAANGQRLGIQAIRRGLGDQNPLFWLGMRGRFASGPSLLLCAVVVVYSGWLLLAVPPRAVGKLTAISAYSLIGLHLILKFLAATEACRRLSEDRACGALELLLVTPIRIKALIRGYSVAFWRRVALPVVMIAGLNILWVEHNHEDHVRLVFFGGMLIAPFDVLAIGSLGMWYGLRSASYPRALFATLGRVLLLPWIPLLLFIMAGVNGGIREETANVFFSCWFVGCALYDIFLAIWARQNLEGKFRAVATGQEFRFNRSKRFLNPPVSQSQAEIPPLMG